jgi:dTDP-4-dehydrorhamnose 3,5-epimerase
MIFSETKLRGAYIIEIEKQEDERGFFVRTWDAKKFEELGLNPKLVQCSISFNKKKGTLRGMHYQIPPYEEVKLIRCTKGKIFDVIIDLRTNSEKDKNWIGIELTADNYKMLYVPEGFAHGFQTLEDNTEVFYQMSEFHMPSHARTIKWNDKEYRIKWPLKPIALSKNDSSTNSEEKSCDN